MSAEGNNFLNGENCSCDNSSNSSLGGCANLVRLESSDPLTVSILATLYIITTVFSFSLTRALSGKIDTGHPVFFVVFQVGNSKFVFSHRKSYYLLQEALFLSGLSATMLAIFVLKKLFQGVTRQLLFFLFFLATATSILFHQFSWLAITYLRSNYNF